MRRGTPWQAYRGRKEGLDLKTHANFYKGSLLTEEEAAEELDLNSSVMFNDVSGAAAVAKTISTETRVNNTSTKEI